MLSLPSSGHLFVFFNKPKNKCKILFYDQGGLCLFCKRLELGTFSIPPSSLTQTRIEIDRVEFIHFLDGIIVAESINLFEIPPAETNPFENTDAFSKAEGPALPLTHVPAHKRAPKGHGRSPWPKQLERVDTVVNPSETNIICSCCDADKIVIGEDVTEVLEKRPDPYFVNHIGRKCRLFKCSSIGRSGAGLLLCSCTEEVFSGARIG